jgi:glucose/arabinose dehydrogenase
LLTLTPPSREGAPRAVLNQPADLATTAGWSCGDFPCADNIDEFMQRIRVPAGYQLDYIGRFPGQPLQITYGPDARLYATVLEDSAARTGAVYALDADGRAERYAGDFFSPVGLAFQPGTDVLYVSSRLRFDSGGVLWRVVPGRDPEPVLDDLPCCYGLIDNQPNGLIFGPDGYLYLGVGALTDHGESSSPASQAYADIQPLEAAVLRIQPHTAEVEVYAQGLRNPYDLTFDSGGKFFATDQGMVNGLGDRLLGLDAGAHYGWPYWRTRFCEGCPIKPAGLTIAPDLVNFPPLSIPRGLVAYTGAQFPANMFDSLFVVLWNGTEHAQRVVRLDPLALARPDENGEAPVGEPFVTGLIRPIDVTIDPDGALVVADFIYGHIWRVRYVG